MKQQEFRKTASTVTFCIAFLLWGSIFVLRTVTNRNYHTPQPLTIAQQHMKAYEDCLSYNAPTKAADCRALAEKQY